MSFERGLVPLCFLLKLSSMMKQKDFTPLLKIMKLSSLHYCRRFHSFVEDNVIIQALVVVSGNEPRVCCANTTLKC